MELAILAAGFLIFGGLLFMTVHLERLSEEIAELRKAIIEQEQQEK